MAGTGIYSRIPLRDGQHARVPQSTILKPYSLRSFVLRFEQRESGLDPGYKLNLHSTQSLVDAAGLAVARVQAAESGAGVLMFDDLEKIARVLEVKVVELFFSPGRTAAERMVLGLLEGNGHE